MILKLDYKIVKFVLFVCLCQRVYGLYPSSSEVVDLTAANFDRLVLQSDAVWIVEFYAPWCRHCQQLVPEYSKVATALKGVIKVGAINGDAHKSIGSKYGVQGFPTIKIFGADKSKPEEYQQDRAAKSIIDAAFSVVRKNIYVQLSGCSEGKKKFDKNTDDFHDNSYDNKEIIELTDKNFDDFVLKSDDIWLVQFYVPWCGNCKNLAAIMAEAGIELKSEIKIGALDVRVYQQTASRHKINDYRNDKTLVEYNTGGRRSASEIVNWVMDKYVSALPPPPEIHELIDDKVLNEVCDKDKIQLCIISILPDILDCQSECRNNYISTLKEIAGKFKTKLWGWLWNGALKQPNIEEAFEMGGFGYPTMVVVNFKKMKYSLFRGSFSKDGIYEFLRDLAFGCGANISPIKNSTMPKIKTIEPWAGLDGQLSEDDDIDLSDVVWVVKYYAPWCEHCQQLVPEYSKVATALKGVIKVGAINVDEHKSIGRKYGVQSFPTIKIFGADKSKPEEYQQDRTAKSIIDAAFSVLRKKVNVQLSGCSEGKKKFDKNTDVFHDNSYDNKEIIELTRHKINDYPTIKFFDKNDKTLVEYYTGGRRSASEIVNWVMDKYVNTLPSPEIHELIDDKVLNEVCDKDKIQLCIISILPHILDCESECRNNYLSTLKEVAGKFKTKLWGWLWNGNLAENGALKQANIEEAFEMGFGYPTMVVVDLKNMKFALFKGSFSKDGIYEFLNDLVYLDEIDEP